MSWLTHLPLQIQGDTPEDELFSVAVRNVKKPRGGSGCSWRYFGTGREEHWGVVLEDH